MFNKVLICITLLLGLFSTANGTEFNYMLSAGYLYDSNIAQNVNEEGKGYFLPEGHLRLRGDVLFGEIATIYENYITERSPVLNSPFHSNSSRIDLENGDVFSFRSKLRLSLYYGQKNASDREDEPLSWFPAKNSYRWYNNFQWDINRSRIFFNTKMQLNDYGEDKQDAFRLTIEPQYRYRFRVLSTQAIALKSLSFVPVYEGNVAANHNFSYNYWELGVNATTKLWGSSLKLGVSYAAKNFGGEIKHPILEEPITVENDYFYTNGTWTIPIFDPLDIKIQGKLRFKGSNNPSYAWNRHTFGIKLVWRGGREW